jgi:hypothetical protein
MFNLTHNETSAVDIGGVWTGPDEFELTFRINTDDEEDLNIHLILSTEEIEQFVEYLQSKLAANKLRQM